MKLYQKLKSLPGKRQIAIAVWAVHFGAVFFLFGKYSLSHRLQPAKKISVRTIAAQEIAKVPTISKKSSSAPVKKNVPAVKKAAPNKPAVQKEKKQDAVLLKEIANRLDVLTQDKHLKSETKPLPAVPSLPIAKNENKNPSARANYGEFLIGYFQENLDLPEYGDVKAQIEIDKFGKLTSYEILEAKSLKNAEFLKNALPELTFPCLNDFGIFETAQTFTITFRNVETR